VGARVHQLVGIDSLSRRAAILSLRLVRYRFSIMLCAVFFGGWPLSFLPDGAASRSSSSSSSDDFRFLLLAAGSGDECDEDELALPLFSEAGLWWRLGVEAGAGGPAKADGLKREAG